MALDNENQALAFFFPAEFFLYFLSPQMFFLCMSISLCVQYSTVICNPKFQCLGVLFLTDQTCKGVGDLSHGSGGAFCLHLQFFIVLQLKSPLIILSCRSLSLLIPAMLLPVAFFQCGMPVLTCSAPWVSFLAERHWKSFSSSVLFSHFN